MCTLLLSPDILQHINQMWSEYKWLPVAAGFYTRGPKRQHSGNKTRKKTNLNHAKRPWQQASIEGRKDGLTKNKNCQIKKKTFLLLPLPFAVAYLLSITVNITEQEVDGWMGGGEQALCTMCLFGSCLVWHLRPWGPCWKSRCSLMYRHWNMASTQVAKAEKSEK